ncbi:MAG: sensor domain-containing protein [Nocardia sp.]|nr:sensor domain-containing protein [Nocardia sp.]
MGVPGIGRLGRVVGCATVSRVVGCAMLSWALAACGSTLPGHPVAAREGAITGRIGSDLASMLPGAQQFPPDFSTATPTGDGAVAAIADLTAIPAGAQVDPADCAPQRADPNATGVEVGTGSDGRSTVTVVLTRTGEPLSAARERLSRCKTVRARHEAIDRTITTELLPPPPVDADDSLAFGRTTAGGPAGSGADPVLRTLLAQIGDVRVQATTMAFGSNQPDATAVDQVFTAAVGDVRKR